MHNVIAEGLKKVMDTDDMDHVFFEARQINIALLNHITYNEFLPAVVGEANVNKFLQLRLVSILMVELLNLSITNSLKNFISF